MSDSATLSKWMESLYIAIKTTRIAIYYMLEFVMIFLRFLPKIPGEEAGAILDYG